jgi:predicted phage terminase large subunit-like protein
VDGEVDGEPVLLTREQIAEKRKDQGPYIFSCQFLLDPKGDETQGFKEEWLQRFDPDEGDGMNKYILVDSASSKKQSSDYTAAWVVGLGEDNNFYLLDIIRDRLNLTQKADMIFSLHRKWKPDLVGYERYGMMGDIEHIQDRMERENYHFEIVELGGQMPKNDRIRRLIPLFEQKRMFLPHSLWKTDYEGIERDLATAFIEEEYKAFPVALHDDMLDALSRILDEDMKLTWPMAEEDEPRRERYTGGQRSQPTSWMTA